MSIGEISPMAKCWTTIGDRRLRLRRSRPEAVLVDPQSTDFRFEGRARNAEPCRGAGWSVNPSAACPQCLLDQCLLVSGDCAGQRKWAFDRWSRGQPALVDGEFLTVADYHRPFDHVLQFPHIAGP